MGSGERPSARKPEWLKQRLPSGSNLLRTQHLLSTHSLHTVCQEALCPNRPQCFHRGTATFLLLGTRCTRSCRFCAVNHGCPDPPDPREPDRIVAAVREMKISFVVLTSVTRDDLPDGGASQFRRTVEALRSAVPGIQVEALVPDFQGSNSALREVLASGICVFTNSNLTIEELHA